MNISYFAPYIFRLCSYVMFGLCLEIIFSVIGIEIMLGRRVKRRVPRKYLEGFVSLYMIPVHGLGCLFGIEWLIPRIIDLNIFVRFLIWAILISVTEILWGIFYDKVFGFYSWDYYSLSKFKVLKRGYTLWTLIPMWGLCGLVLEKFYEFLIYLSPFVSRYFI